MEYVKSHLLYIELLYFASILLYEAVTDKNRIPVTSSPCLISRYRQSFPLGFDGDYFKFRNILFASQMMHLFRGQN